MVKIQLQIYIFLFKIWCHCVSFSSKIRKKLKERFCRTSICVISVSVWLTVKPQNCFGKSAYTERNSAVVILIFMGVENENRKTRINTSLGLGIVNVRATNKSWRSDEAFGRNRQIARQTYLVQVVAEWKGWRTSDSR